MRCSLIGLLLLTLVATPAADAAPRAVARLDILGDQLGIGHLALAGDHLLYVSVDGPRLRVYTVPVSGGSPRVVFERVAPAGRDAYGAIAASADRVALVAGDNAPDGHEPQAQVFAGPADGPLTPISEPITDYPFPAFARVDGDRVFDYRFTGDRFDARVFAHDPDEHEIPFDDLDQGNSAMFAGDLVAYREPYEDWTRLQVRNWRTGAIRSTRTFSNGIYTILLRHDGRAAVSLFNGELWDANPRRRLLRSASNPQLAGERIVYLTASGLRVRDPDGSTRPFGTISRSIAPDLVADTRHVAWSANGCLLIAHVTEARAAVPRPGPCSRTEFSVDPNRVALARTLPVPLTCVSAPHRCHGTLRVTRYGRRVRFDVPPGRTRTVRARLTEKGRRALRRRLEQHPGGVLISLTARSTDGATQRPTFTVARHLSSSVSSGHRRSRPKHRSRWRRRPPSMSSRMDA